ncbi:MAG: phasin family protein [Geminicoccaceae bacterium]
MDSEQVTPSTERTAAAEQDQAALYAAGFNSLVSARHAVIDGCHAVSMEMLAFWQSRLKEGFATGQRLLACDSPESALEVQLDYAKAALQAYVDQSVKAGNLVSRSLTRICQPAKPEAPEPPALAA